jgi:hypothetical protein
MFENIIKDYTFSKDTEKSTQKLGASQKVLAAALAGAFSCWNQPIEVVRIEMQSQLKAPGRPDKMTMLKAVKWIYSQNGVAGFYRGISPRILLGVWQTVCMVYGGELVKNYFS